MQIDFLLAQKMNKQDGGGGKKKRKAQISGNIIVKDELPMMDPIGNHVYADSLHPYELQEGRQPAVVSRYEEEGGYT